MTLSKPSQSFSLDKPGIQPDAQTPKLQFERAFRRPVGVGNDYRPMMTFAPLPLPATRQVPPPEPEEIHPVPPPEPEEIRPLIRRQGLLGRLFALLFCGGAPAAKKLCLAETVALGEKRFVAIIHAEGHKYLIGGSSTGVALLTQLDDSATLAKNLHSLQGAVEAAG